MYLHIHHICKRITSLKYKITYTPQRDLVGPVLVHRYCHFMKLGINIVSLNYVSFT
jgi:hypothetical protein